MKCDARAVGSPGWGGDAAEAVFELIDRLGIPAPNHLVVLAFEPFVVRRAVEGS